MALEAMTFQQDLPVYYDNNNNNNNNNRDFHNLLEVVNWSSCDDDWNNTSPPGLQWWCPNASPEELLPEDTPPTMSARPRRRRSRAKKNQEEIENQRMTHITIERNRRKQMNEYLTVLRGLMPESYAQKGDQASIVGAAINYVKELEQQLHFCSGRRHTNEENHTDSSASPFSEFFTFPQYSTGMMSSSCEIYGNQSSSAAADIEVTIVDSHANLKIRSNKRLKQLSRIVCGLESLRLTILHLNVITVDHTVLYCLSLKVENDCRLTLVDDIAAAVNRILRKIQEESCS